MAKIGLNNFRYGILTEAPDGTPSYSGAVKPAKAISCSVDISTNDAKLYADDALAESDTTFQSGTVAAGIDEEDQATMAALLGHQVVDGAIVRSSNDLAPYVGWGRVVVKMVGGLYKYKVEFLYKVKFAEPSQEDTTKGESLEFGTSTLNGQVATLANGKWSVSKTFNTQADAISYLEGLLSTTTSYTITYNANGGSGTVASQTVTAGAEVELSDGTGLTYASHTFLGWSKNPAATAPTVTSPYMPDDDTTLYAVWHAD